MAHLILTITGASILITQVGEDMVTEAAFMEVAVTTVAVAIMQAAEETTILTTGQDLVAEVKMA